VQFHSDMDGYVTGVRFYKSAANTGTHAGHLWSNSGALLASATFVNETPSGWQQVNFSNPVPITANTLYVASYQTSVGHFGLDQGYFTAFGVTIRRFMLRRIIVGTRMACIRSPAAPLFRRTLLTPRIMGGRGLRLQDWSERPSPRHDNFSCQRNAGKSDRFPALITWSGTHTSSRIRPGGSGCHSSRLSAYSAPLTPIALSHAAPVP